VQGAPADFAGLELTAKLTSAYAARTVELIVNILRSGGTIVPSPTTSVLLSGAVLHVYR